MPPEPIADTVIVAGANELPWSVATPVVEPTVTALGGVAANVTKFGRL